MDYTVYGIISIQNLGILWEEVLEGLYIQGIYYADLSISKIFFIELTLI